MARPLRLALVGFGNVGRYFAEQLAGRYGKELKGAGVAVTITGIATRRHGTAIDPKGLPLGKALHLVKAGRSLEPLHRGRKAPASALEFVKSVPADVLIEISTLDVRGGEPATAHIRAALGRGLHVITANKGPVAFARKKLMALARSKKVHFLHEGVVMDGAPIFNLVESCLRGAKVNGFRGLLNSTTTRILSDASRGLSYEEALADAQKLGVAEADPSLDVDGWDAAVKACALANALLDADVEPADVVRAGIGPGVEREAREARARGERLRLVARARREAGRVRISVGPEAVPAGDPLALDDVDGVLVLETDLMREVAIVEGRGGVDQTAYALLSDLMRIIEAPKKR